MERVFAITILILALTAADSFAQMGHGMMRDSQMMEQGHMTGQQGMQGQQEMIGSGQMMGNMSGLAREMSNMMGQISETMGNMTTMNKNISRERIHGMSSMMRDMAAEMNRISWIMDKGIVSAEEMGDIQNRIRVIQRRMNDFNR